MRWLQAFFLVSVIGATGCEEATVVVVEIQGAVPAEVKVLRTTARLDGRAAKVLEHPAAERVPRFGLTLPSGARGSLSVRVEGLDALLGEPRCIVASGEGVVIADGERARDLPLFISRLPADQRACSLFIERQGQGRVTSMDGQFDCGERCTMEVAVNQPLVLTAQPQPGSYFERWTGEGVSCTQQDPGGANACPLKPQGPLRVIAQFTPNPPLTLTIEGKGATEGDLPCQDQCSLGVVPGKKVRFAARTQARYRFVGYEVPPQAGSCADPLAPCEITMGTAAMTVKARFEAKTCAGEWCVENPVGGAAGKDLWAVSGRPESSTWAVGAAGTVLRFEAAAGRWTRESIPTTAEVRSVWAQSGERVWAVTATEVFTRSRAANAPPQWELVPNVGLSTGIQAVGGVGGAGGDVFVAADQGRIRVRRGRDLGRGWETKDLGKMTDLWAIAHTGSALFVAGGASTIRREEGATWALEDAPAGHVLLGLWGIDDNVWAAGQDGMLKPALFRRTARGSWEKEAVTVTERLTGIAGSVAGEFWVSGAKGTLLHHQGSLTTVDVTALTSQDLRGVYSTDGKDVWVVGNGETILHREP